MGVGITVAAGIAGGGTGALQVGILTTQLASLAATPIGAYIGGGIGKERMAKEYAQAEAQQHAHALEQQQSRSQEPELEQEVAHEKSNHFTQMVEKQRSDQLEHHL